jgi:electron transfer flavoprotein beta subunit
MKIVVVIEHVPDTETKIKIGPDGRSIDEASVKWVMSPYDEFALEQALRIRDASGGEVVLVCAGREGSQPTLRQGLAMGADRAVLIQDGRLERCDGLVRSKALAAVARCEGAELVLVGKYGVGSDEWHTAPMLGELLDWPHATAVTKLTLGDGAFTAEKEIEGAVEIVEGRLPAVISCDKGLNEPRYASLKGIMQAKKKPLDLRTPADVQVDENDLAQPMLVWESLELPPPRRKGVLLSGSAVEAARELARILRDEEKVI